MKTTRRYTNDFDALVDAKDYLGNGWDVLTDMYLKQDLVFDVSKFSIRREIYRGINISMGFAGVRGRPVRAFIRLVLNEHRRRLRELRAEETKVMVA